MRKSIFNQCSDQTNNQVSIIIRYEITEDKLWEQIWIQIGNHVRLEMT
tara:strand:- start:110 stop:253 length:144 start_codon:yes stop_codon:yes gene_type:complete